MSVDKEGSTIGKSMDSAAEIGKRGVRTIRSGVASVTKAAGKIPDVVGKVARKQRTGTTKEYIIVEDLPEALKEYYLGVLVWLVNVDDNEIDERELCEIQLLMTQLRCNADVRKAVRSRLEDPQGPDVEALVKETLTRVPSGQSDTEDALRFSLIKDAIRVRRATSDGAVREQSGICRLAKALGLNDDQIKVIEAACAEDERILGGDVSDSEIRKAAKSMAEQAAAVGVPVAAVYLSGSVTGLSAAGIVSGLAALGLGGVLGLSAMVTGIGVAILVGETVRRSVRWALRGSERNRASRRELMLKEVLRIHQGAIVNLSEDISFFGKSIASLANEMERNRVDLNRLSREVMLLSQSADALTRLGERASDFESELQEEVASQADR